MLRISFDSEGFPPGTIPNGASELDVTWDDLLWAAVTVGRPNRHYVFRHGDASRYEAVFRWSVIRMALEQRGPGTYRLRRTNAARTLDPTEKGAVNYFLGMTMCKLFASKLLNAPWLLHLDVFRPQLDVELAGRSRPDLIGLTHYTSHWHAFECKGRISPPDRATKTKAKSQATRVISVNGISCCLHVGAITYFRSDVLRFYWCDPPGGEAHIEAPFAPDAWAFYYQPFFQAFVAAGGNETTPASDNPLVLVEDLDLRLGISPAIARHLFAADWNGARHAATDVKAELTEARYQPDGLLVKAGPSWHQRFKESYLAEG